MRKTARSVVAFCSVFNALTMGSTAASPKARSGETFDLLLGRRTYDLWSAFWPKAPRSKALDRTSSRTFAGSSRTTALT